MFGPESKNSASDARFAVSSPMAVTEETAEEAKVKIPSKKSLKPISGKTTNNLSDQAEGKSEGSSIPESGTDAETDSDTPLAKRLLKVDLVSKLNSKYGAASAPGPQAKHWWKGDVEDSGRAHKASPRTEAGAVSLSLLECPRCSELLGDVAALRRHQRERHPKERRMRTFRCDECRSAFASPQSLASHLSLHSRLLSAAPDAARAYKCGRCEKVFARFHNFVTHTRAHGHAKAFRCVECGAAFDDFALFCGHMETHGSRRAFRCCVCEEVFANPFDLSPHMKTHR